MKHTIEKYPVEYMTYFHIEGKQKRLWGINAITIFGVKFYNHQHIVSLEDQK